MEIENGSIDAIVLPPLPQTVWDIIVQLIFDPVLEFKDALIQIKFLSLVSQSLCRACKNAVLRLDARHSLDAHVAALAKLPISVEYLNLDDFYNREYVLRSATFRKHSALTLRHLSAAITTTDTLADFPLLENLTFHGQESFPKLYPAVLENNLIHLHHLELVNYEHEVVTDEVPLDVLRRLQSLTVRPRSDGRQFRLHGKEIPFKLKNLTFDSSFDSLQSAYHALTPEFSLPLILAAAENILIEAGSIGLKCDLTRMPLPPEMSNFGSTEPLWVAAVLLHAPSTLKRINIRLLQSRGVFVKENPPQATSSFHLYGVGSALEELAPGGKYKDMQWSYTIETQSIFNVFHLSVRRSSLLIDT
jgi:hypothetical protein